METKDILKEYIKDEVLKAYLTSRQSLFSLLMIYSSILALSLVVYSVFIEKISEENFGKTILALGIIGVSLIVLATILFDFYYKKIKNNMNNKIWISINSFVESLNFSSPSITYKNGFDFKESYQDFLVEKISGNKVLLKRKDEYKEVHISDLFDSERVFLINGKTGATFITDGILFLENKILGTH